MKEATDEELAKLSRWQEVHPEDDLVKHFIDSIKGVIKDENDQVIDVNAWAEKRWDHILPGINDNNSPAEAGPETPPEKGPKERRLFKGRWYVAAAVFIVIILAGVLIFWLPSVKQSDTKEIRLAAEDGKRFNTVLPDGTGVWLNSGSLLVYKETGEKDRVVELEGEAYFDIYPNEKEPFIIHTEKQDIRVLGTKLEVKAYKEDATEETALLSGSIRVSVKEGIAGNDKGTRAGNRDFTLTPGRKIVLSRKRTPALDGRPVSGITADGWNILLDSVNFNGKDDICDDVAWIYNKLVFNKKPFVDLAQEMERWYNVKIIFQNESLKKEIFSGAFDKQSITEALKALQLTTDFSFRQQGNKVYLW